jgi:hypothetical protein
MLNSHFARMYRIPNHERNSSRKLARHHNKTRFVTESNNWVSLPCHIFLREGVAGADGFGEAVFDAEFLEGGIEVFFIVLIRGLVGGQSTEF